MQLLIICLFFQTFFHALISLHSPTYSAIDGSAIGDDDGSVVGKVDEVEVGLAVQFFLFFIVFGKK